MYAKNELDRGEHKLLHQKETGFLQRNVEENINKDNVIRQLEETRKWPCTKHD